MQPFSYLCQFLSGNSSGLLWANDGAILRVLTLNEAGHDAVFLMQIIVEFGLPDVVISDPIFPDAFSRFLGILS